MEENRHVGHQMDLWPQAGGNPFCDSHSSQHLELRGGVQQETTGGWNGHQQLDRDQGNVSVISSSFHADKSSTEKVLFP